MKANAENVEIKEMKIEEKTNRGQAFRTSIQSRLRRMAHVAIRHSSLRVSDSSDFRLKSFTTTKSHY
jgi:hypothetical protein